MTRFATIAVIALFAAAPALADTENPGAPDPAQEHARMHDQTHGADGTGHDEATMPGLRGLDATREESAELQEMFMNFAGLNRTVEVLQDGIRTYTWSDDPALAATLISHVTGMTNRVAEGRDPKVFIQSPTLDILFERAGSITTEIETTDEGITVTQTSTDPEVVAALQTHAGEVTDMAARGMVAVHEMMMKRAPVN